MKKMTKLSLFVMALFLASCSSTPDELIKGDWTFEKIEILEYDKFIKSQIEFGTSHYESNIKKAEAEIKNSKDKAFIDTQETSIIEYQENIKNLPEKAENDRKIRLQNFNNIIETKVKMSFKEDKSYEIKFTENDLITGTWKLSDDKKTVLVTQKTNEDEDEDKIIEYLIENISENKLTLMLIEKEDGMTMSIIIVLRK